MPTPPRGGYTILPLGLDTPLVVGEGPPAELSDRDQYNVEQVRAFILRAVSGGCWNEVTEEGFSRMAWELDKYVCEDNGRGAGAQLVEQVFDVPRPSRRV